VFDDDWFLALAAYNAGKGNIRKAIRKNKNKDLATNYWSLPLRAETQSYVPRLLAIAKILANADKYNIPLINIPNTPYFEVVNIASQIDISIAAKMADTSLDDFFILNPAFKRASTDPDGPFHLLIHTDKSAIFKRKLAKTVKKDRMKWIRHKISAGENLGIIAKKYNTSVNALIKGNHLANSNIRAGKYLLIPASLSKASILNAKTKRQLYTVKKGDTFWDIARQFDVHSKDIALWNKLSLNKMLRPGQKLIIEDS
jgi:membrane-bound lytic murein transglycosylase D